MRTPLSLTLACLLAAAALLLPAALAQDETGTGRARPTRPGDEELARHFRSYERLTLDTKEAARQVRQTGRLAINAAGRVFDLELEPHNMRAENYRAEETVAPGVTRRVWMGAVRTYKGRVLGSAGTDARFTIDERRLDGMILTPEERYYVEPASRYLPSAARTEFLFYKASDVIETEPLSCAAPLLHDKIRDAVDQLDGSAPAKGGPQPLAALASPLEVELATEADGEYVTALGGSANANSEILSIMNQVEAVYQREINLFFKITNQHTWTSASTDPYTSADPVTTLNQLTDYWNANFTNVQRDVVHMWTGKNLTGTAGVAWGGGSSGGVVCSKPNVSYGLSERIAVFPQKVVLPAHELGHNFNAVHTDGVAGCANTIMQAVATDNSVLSFCQASRDRITAHINANSSCLSAPPPCTFTISPTSASVPAAGGSGTFSVTASDANCAWTAASNAAWLHVTAGASGNGSGRVSYSADANIAITSRTGTITAAGKTFTVTQAAVACTFSISPTSASYPAAGGSGSVTVTAPANCAWTAASNATWLHITAGASGSGSGTVSYSVDANSATASRQGTLTIAGKTFTLTQAAAACTFSITPTGASFTSAGGSGKISVTTTAGCAWRAVSNATWLHITAGASGSGSGTVSYTVDANTATASRTGTITAAGKTFTVTQGAAPCTFSISPTSASFTSAGGTGRISVTAPAGCAWTARSNVTWITITAGASGNGSGAVSYSVAANSATTSRTGTITAAGKTFTVTQAAAPPSLSSLVVNPPTVIGGCQSATGTVTLSAAAPSGGTTVTLSDNLAATTLPASVTVPAGSKTRTFTISTAAVTADQSGTVTAKLGSVTRTDTLVVRRIGVRSVSVSPNPVIGGDTATGTVTLECPAAPGNITVTLSDNLAATTLPASVVVSAGTTSKTFQITTVAVSANQTGALTASAGGVSRSVNVTVRRIGIASLTLNPNPVTGGQSSTGTVTLERAAAPGSITVTLTSSNPSVATVPPSITIPAGTKSKTFTVTTSNVAATTTVTITATANRTSKSATLTVNPGGEM